MIFSLCLLLSHLKLTSHGNCSSPGTLPSPTIFLDKTSAQEGDSVLAQCSVFFQIPATRIIFCKDGKAVSSLKGKVGILTYNFNQLVSRNSSGNYSCGYEINDHNNQVTSSQLSSARFLKVTDVVSHDDGEAGSIPTGPAMSLAVWVVRSILVLLLLVSAPIITFVLEFQSQQN